MLFDFGDGEVVIFLVLGVAGLLVVAELHVDDALVGPFAVLELVVLVIEEGEGEAVEGWALGGEGFSVDSLDLLRWEFGCVLDVADFAQQA